MVRILGKFLPISLKTTTEVARFIKGYNVNKAITLLKEVAAAKRPIPFLKYKKDVPHRKGQGMSVGRFPKKVSEELIKLLELLKANAKDKGLDAEKLIIIHAATQSGPKMWHYGRLRRRRRKVSHFELVAQESKPSKEKIKND